MIYETPYRESGICEMNFFVIIFWILAFSLSALRLETIWKEGLMAQQAFVRLGRERSIPFFFFSM